MAETTPKLQSMGAPADLLASAGLTGLPSRGGYFPFSFLFLSFSYLLRARGPGWMESWTCQSIIHPLFNKSIITSALSLDVSGIGAQDTYLYLVRFGEMTF